MRFLGELRYRLHALLHRTEMDAELDEELRDHLERESAAIASRGLPDDAAHQRAAAAFGGVTRHAEAARDARGWRWLDDLGGDIRHAFRLLRRYPWFSGGVIGLAALGIGAATMVYSAVYGVLLRPLPFPDGNRIVSVQLRAGSGSYPAWSPETFQAVASQDQVIAAAGMYTSNNMILMEQGIPENIRAELLMPSLLAMLGVKPQLGRLFVEDDAQRDLPVALLSDAIWRQRFGADSGVVGRSVRLSNRLYTIIGVMPRDFIGPRLNPAALWAPVRFGPTGLFAAGERQRGGMAFFKLKPGVTRERAEAWINGHLRLDARDVLTSDTVTARAEFTPLQDLVVLDQATPLWILLGAVGLVLILVASNVATMGLARASVREHEMAVRKALGAGRGRQARQILTETLVLMLIGGLVGVGLARVGLALFMQAGVDILPRVRDIRMDAPVLAFAFAVTVISGLVAALVPSLARRDASLVETFIGTAARGGGARGNRLRAVLVGTEVALSIMLLVGAGLLLKGFLKVVPSQPGFALDHRINLRFNHGSAAGADTLDHAAFVRDITARVRGLRGVRDVAVATMMPLVRSGAIATLHPEGMPVGDKPPRGWQFSVTPNYFRVMDEKIVRGRDFTDRDDRSAPTVVIINETAASRWWPGQDPVGKRLVIDRLGSTRRPSISATVIGVSHDVRADGERVRPNAEFFLPFDQAPDLWINLIVHTTGEPHAMVPALKQEVWRLLPGNPINEVSTLEEIASDSVKGARFYTVLIGIFAAIAVILAAAGLFSVLAYTVSRRTREIGIRMAVGASRRSVAALVLRQSVVIAGTGLAAGLVGARLLTRYIASILLEVTPTDIAVFVMAAGVLLVVVVAACAFPLRRALTVDPVTSLRAE
jgi:predicted permease